MNARVPTTPVGVAIAMIGGLRATVFLVLLVAALIALAFCAWRHNSEQASNATLRAQVAAFQSTQQSNLDTITRLQREARVSAERRKLEEQANAAAVRGLTEQLLDTEEANRRQQQRIAALMAEDKDASRWGETGVDAGVAALLPGGRR